MAVSTRGKNVRNSSSTGPRPTMRGSRPVPSPKPLNKGNLESYARMSAQVARHGSLFRGVRTNPEKSYF